LQRYLEDLGLWFDVQIDWLRGVVAAVALLPRSHIDLPTKLARGSYAREILRLNQMRGQMKHCRRGWFCALVMALLKKRVFR